MFNTDTGYSLADVAAAANNTNDAFGGNNGWWIILLFLFIFSGGWGFGNNRGVLGNTGTNTTSSGITDGYVLTSDFANIERKIDGVDNGLCDGFYTEAQLINGVNSNINTASQGILTQMNNNAINAMKDNFTLQTTMNNNTNTLTAQNTALGTQLQQAICNNRYENASNFATLGYNLADQGCQIRQGISNAAISINANNDANTRSILDTLQEMQTSAMQDKINTLTADNQALKFAASQAAQNAYLVDQLGAKVAQAAYVVPNPYTGQYGYTCPCLNS